MDTLRPQQRFGRYVIEDVLGTGGMGQVYKAHDDELQRLVALKVLRADPDRSDEDAGRARERLFREARAAAALDHVNAVSIFDVGEVDGNPFIAMELVVGKSLRVMVGDKSVPVRERIRWLVDVARALAAAHARGLVHRDVKPDNVMLREDGTIKVLDFGIARRSHGSLHPPSRSDSAPQTLTHEGAIVGTPLYMAPEQLRGEPLDGRADQFAWGVLAYEMLTGSTPWSGDQQSYRLVSAILTEEAKAPRELSPDVPAPVERVVLRALAKDRAERFPSMDAVVASLSSFITGESAMALAPTMETPLVNAGASLAAAQAPSKRERHPAVTVVAFMAAAAVASAVGWAGLHMAGQRAVAPAASGVAAVSQPALIVITDLPVPESSVVEARAAYTTGLQGIRDGSVIPAVQDFARAATLDPLMAAAHLRVHMYGWYYSEAGSGHFQKALDLRGRLTPRDQALLDALSPAYFTLPKDYPETSRRLEVLAAQARNDVELQYIAAGFQGDNVQRAARLEAVAQMDPRFATPIWWLASDLMQREGPSLDAVGALVDRCLQASPTSQSCLLQKTARDDALGQCDLMEQDTQRLIARNGGWRSYDVLARALAARGAPTEALRTALEQKWGAQPSTDAAVSRGMDEAAIAILHGDFTEAERRVRALEESLAGDPNEDEHEDPAWLHADIETETGRVDLAAKVGDDFLRRRAGWKSEGAYSPRPLFYAFAVRGGLRSDAERRADLAAWLREWKTDPWYESQRWVHGYAFPAATRQDGLDALAAAPTPVPRVMYHQGHREGIDAVGRVYLLAGRAHDAVPHLREAAGSCSVLATPIAHTRANLELGQALEADGDTAGACSAYAVVLSRWGHAKPRSVSADLARARAAALKCVQ